jgi:serine/threonine protein kinase
LRGLEILHNYKTIHTDLRPANIFIDGNKLVIFCTYCDKDKILGINPYMSPEWLEKNEFFF